MSPSPPNARARTHASDYIIRDMEPPPRLVGRDWPIALELMAFTLQISSRTKLVGYPIFSSQFCFSTIFSFFSLMLNIHGHQYRCHLLRHPSSHLHPQYHLTTHYPLLPSSNRTDRQEDRGGRGGGKGRGRRRRCRDRTVETRAV